MCIVHVHVQVRVWPPTPDLVAFLASCPEPPIYFGWGSMAAVSPAHMVEVVLRALMTAGRRGVMLAGDLPLTTYHLPLTTYYLPLTTYHLLLTTY